MDNFEKFTAGLPRKDKFYNAMTNRAVKNDKNDKHVLNFWKAFKINTMKRYNELYLKVDVLLLAYMFETFRKESINSFKLDPAHYLSTPGYSKDVILRFAAFNLKLISDIEKYKLVGSATRVGTYMICKDYAGANNGFWKSTMLTRVHHISYTLTLIIGMVMI